MVDEAFFLTVTAEVSSVEDGLLINQNTPAIMMTKTIGNTIKKNFLWLAKKYLIFSRIPSSLLGYSQITLVPSLERSFRQFSCLLDRVYYQEPAVVNAL